MTIQQNKFKNELDEWKNSPDNPKNKTWFKNTKTGIENIVGEYVDNPTSKPNLNRKYTGKYPVRRSK